MTITRAPLLIAVVMALAVVSCDSRGGNAASSTGPTSVPVAQHGAVDAPGWSDLASAMGTTRQCVEHKGLRTTPLFRQGMRRVTFTYAKSFRKPDAAAGRILADCFAAHAATVDAAYWKSNPVTINERLTERDLSFGCLAAVGRHPGSSAEDDLVVAARPLTSATATCLLHLSDVPASTFAAYAPRERQPEVEWLNDDGSPAPQPAAKQFQALAKFDRTTATEVRNVISKGGMRRLTLKVNGIPRTFMVYVGSPTPGPRPLVLWLHGAGSSGAQFLDEVGLKDRADTFGKGTVHVVPDGEQASWNAVGCCIGAARDHVDDLRYLVSLILDFEQTGLIDMSRVGVNGFSNGAMMALRLACGTRGLIHSVGAVGGSLVSPCHAAFGTSFTVIDGQEDRLIRPDGFDGENPDGSPFVYPSLDDAAGDLAHAAGCTGTPVLESKRVGVVAEQQWTSCPPGTKVVTLVVEKLGHGWPGGKSDTTQTDVDATALVASDMHD